MILLWYRLNEGLYQMMGHIEDIVSMVWTERWQDYGEAEITLPDIYTSISTRDLIRIPQRDMISEVVRVTVTKDTVTIKCIDAVSILDRRIVYPTVQNDGSLMTFVDKLLRNDSIIVDSDAESTSRTLSPMKVGDLSAISGVANLQRSYGHLGETLLNLSKAYGFDLNCRFDSGHLRIDARSGGISRVWGVGRFLADYRLDKDMSAFHNVAIIGGQIQNGERVIEMSPTNAAEGMARFEIFVDDRDLPYNGMTYESLVDIYGAMSSPLTPLTIATVTTGSESPYIVTDFIAYQSYRLSSGYQVNMLVSSLRKVLDEETFNTLVVNADTTAKSKIYGGRFNGSTWTFTIGEVEVVLDQSVLLPVGEYDVNLENYRKALHTDGDDTLAQYQITDLIEIATESAEAYVDYRLGDTVTIFLADGRKLVGIVREIIESWDSSGYTATPTIDFSVSE